MDFFKHNLALKIGRMGFPPNAHDQALILCDTQRGDYCSLKKEVCTHPNSIETTPFFRQFGSRLKHSPCPNIFFNDSIYVRKP